GEAAEARPPSRAAESAVAGTARARSAGRARPAAAAVGHLACRAGIRSPIARLPAVAVARGWACPARAVRIRGASTIIVRSAHAARALDALGGGAGAPGAVRVERTGVIGVDPTRAHALREGERAGVPAEAAEHVRLSREVVDGRPARRARRQLEGDRQGAQELLGGWRTVVGGRIRIAEACRVGRRAGKAVVGPAVALPGVGVADGAGPDRDRTLAARALAVLQARVAGVRPAAAARNAVVLAGPGRARRIRDARARLAGPRAAAAAEREQVPGEVDVRVERHAQRGGLAGAAVRHPGCVLSDPVHDARAQLRLRRVRDRQRRAEETPGGGARAVAAGVGLGGRAERQGAVVGTRGDLRERRAHVRDHGRERDADPAAAEIEATAGEPPLRADAARAIARRRARLAREGAARAHVGQHVAAVVLHHPAGTAPDLRGELEHRRRIWRAARAGRGRLAGAAVRAHLTLGTARPARRVTGLGPRLDPVAAAGPRAVRVAAVAVHEVAVVALLVALPRPVAADDRYRSGRDGRRGRAVRSGWMRFAGEDEMVCVDAPGLALA